MSAREDIKNEQAKIEGIESRALPFNENEYQDISDTLVTPSKIQLPKTMGQVEPEPNEPENPGGGGRVTDNEDPA